MLQKLLEKYGITQGDAYEIFLAVEYEYKKEDVLGCLEDYLLDNNIKAEDVSKAISSIDIDVIVNDYESSLGEDSDWRYLCEEAIRCNVDIDDIWVELYGYDDEEEEE